MPGGGGMPQGKKTGWEKTRGGEVLESSATHIFLTPPNYYHEGLC